MAFQHLLSSTGVSETAARHPWWQPLEVRPGPVAHALEFSASSGGWWLPEQGALYSPVNHSWEHHLVPSSSPSNDVVISHSVCEGDLFLL